MGRALDLTGQRFGRLVVIGRLGSNKHRQALWQCQCDCGQKVTVSGQKLKQCNTKSCGCLKLQLLKSRSTKHGGDKTAKEEYDAWTKVRHGGKGCPPEWDDFVQFFCDVGERPSPEHRLARRDYTKPHGPTNTYWRNASDANQLAATDLGEDFVLDLRSIALAEAAARAGEAAA